MPNAHVLRTITQYLTHASSVLEPVRVMLECGHVTATHLGRKRARCYKCKQGARMQQAAGRLYKRTVAKRLVAGDNPVYVRLDRRGIRKKEPAGYRVLQVEVRDVTPGASGRPTKGPRVCEALEIACDAQSVDYVRAQLLEMGARLDGVVLVT